MPDLVQLTSMIVGYIKVLYTVITEKYSVALPGNAKTLHWDEGTGIVASSR